VYTFSNGTLKVVQNKQFSTIKNNYELSFGVHSQINAAQDDAAIQHQHYKFTTIADIANAEVGSTIDVIAVVRSASDMAEITSTKLSGKTLQKRDLVLVDQTLSEVKLTLWGDKAASQAIDWLSSPIVAFKGVKIGDFGGRSLSSVASTSIQVTPDVQEGQQLYRWLSQSNGVVPVGASLTSSGGECVA
jgi:replication factor A1